MNPSGDVHDIAGFLAACIDRGGGACDLRGANLIDAILPDAIADSLAGQPMTTLALDPDALTQEPGAELATPGSPAMDAFIGYASSIGRTSVGAVMPSHFRGKGLREEVARQVVYRNCRLRSDDEPPKTKESYYAVFFFRVEYISDERREQVITSAIDMVSMRPNRGFAQSIPQLVIDKDSPPTGDWLSEDRLGRAFASACDDMSGQVQVHADAMLGNARKRFEVESQRLAEYHDQVGADLLRRIEKESDEKKRRALTDKHETVLADRERKIGELGEKYRIRSRATLTSLLLIKQPKTFFDLLVDRGAMTKRVTFIFDSLLDRLELPLCEQCRMEMTSVTVSSKGAHLCPKCSAL